MTSLADLAPGARSGTASFRLMPTDDFDEGPSTADFAVAAGGRAYTLGYTWTHPTDGEQTGFLLLGVPDAENGVRAAWVDTWHQPELAPLTGTATAQGCRVGYEYAPGWHWEIEVTPMEEGIGLVMRNTVPEGQQGPAGSYDVMRAEWR